MKDLKSVIYLFINRQELAVVCTINKEGHPESALIGIAVSDTLEIIFDTVITSRKYKNILQNPKVSLVIGLGNEISVQYEGTAMILGDDTESKRLKDIYFDVHPDGRERAETWPGLVHIKVTPKWIRYSNFNEPAVIKEIDL